MRYLEDGGAKSTARKQSRLRLVTIRKNLKTGAHILECSVAAYFIVYSSSGEETESSQFFKRVGPSPRSVTAVKGNKGKGSPVKSNVSFGPNEEIPDVPYTDPSTGPNDV